MGAMAVQAEAEEEEGLEREVLCLLTREPLSITPMARWPALQSEEMEQQEETLQVSLEMAAAEAAGWDV